MALDFVCEYDGVPSYPKANSWNNGGDCCSWDGVMCNNVTGNIISLDLRCNCFHGALHSDSSLILPTLEIPYILNSLKRLTHLDLSYNRISGEIPRWFWGISQDTLETLDLSHNLLEGEQLFPRATPNPSTFTSYFDASHNGFTSRIPSSICQMSSLQSLYLSNNNLTGNMPPCFGNITNLWTIDLSSNNFQGPLPVPSPSTFQFNASYNGFNGEISSSICYFGLSFPALRCLIISNNNFVGWWPIEFFLNTSVATIDLSNNNFRGQIPLPSPVTNYYSIASNNIIGNIPSLICNATKLVFIDLSNNGILGRLPQCLVNFSTVLLVLNLQSNLLEGTIPQSFSSRNRLMTLDLSRNQFEGTMPRSFVKCKHLEVLNLGENQIVDMFPRWLGTLPQLKVLILRSNNLMGLLNIRRGSHLFPRLRILDLSNNNFSGPLPANLFMNLKGMMNCENEQEKSLYMTQFFRMTLYENSIIVTMKGLKIELVKILTIFTTIDLSHNSFQGDIPRVIGHLHSLKGLNLTHNHII
ncbi:hypothetical protein EUGRSUZ_F00606, partial [Eucalyptus grandis]